MADDLVSYYNSELSHIRRAAAEFAATHPKIAGRLRLTADAVEDPHVARLIEAFAFLTARVRRKLDDDFPELTDALLEILYPHYLSPLPAMAIVELQPAPELDKAFTIKAGTELETEAVEGVECRFRTVYPVTMLPIRLDAVTLGSRPLTAPQHPLARGAEAVLRLSLSVTVPEGRFDALKPEKLRFFLRGQPQEVYPLYELIHNDTIAVAVADGPADSAPVLLGRQAVKEVGFGADEGMLDYSPRSFLGYRLLSEYFAFPEKFLFFDVELPEKLGPNCGRRIDLFLYLKRSLPALERVISTAHVALGCTPVVNLFRQTAEPIPLDHTRSEYRVVPDARALHGLEIYRVEGVKASNVNGESQGFEPFYAVRHAGSTIEARRYWLATRRAGAPGNPGSDVFLSLVDDGFNPRQPAGWTASVDTLCFNRDLPQKLPFGGGRPRFKPRDAQPAIGHIQCLTAPTPVLRPPSGGRGRWRLISHLALNHLSFDSAEDGADSLREILSLYDFRETAETHSVIQGITGLKARRSVARAPETAASAKLVTAFCRGLDIDLEFDDTRFSGAGLYLLAMVLERFMGLYCSINAFTRLTARIKGHKGILKTWPPRAGEKIIL